MRTHVAEHPLIAHKLTALRDRIVSPRARIRGASRIDLEVEKILEHYHVRRYVKVSRTVRAEHDFKQTRRGRPGPDTAYRRITHRRYDLEWTIDAVAVAYDEKSDGMYPLITNDRTLTAQQVLEAHKGQPRLEKRFEQLKKEGQSGQAKAGGSAASFGAK